MLTNQTFQRPVVIALSARLFNQPDAPFGINLSLVETFRRRVQDTVCGMDFWFLDLATPENTAIHTKLEKLKVNLKLVMLLDPAQHREDIAALYQLVDAAYVSDLTEHPLAMYRNMVVGGTPESFIGALSEYALGTAPFDFAKFKNSAEQN